jgi:hypothetical protein
MKLIKYMLQITFLLYLLSCTTKENKLEPNTQKIQLQYVAFACACANWATAKDIKQYSDTGNLSEHCIFVEPENLKLTLSDTLGYNGDIVEFTGKYYVNKGYPKDYLQNEEPVEKAKVFRYTSYKIIDSNHQEFLTN